MEIWQSIWFSGKVSLSAVSDLYTQVAAVQWSVLVLPCPPKVQVAPWFRWESDVNVIGLCINSVMWLATLNFRQRRKAISICSNLYFAPWLFPGAFHAGMWNVWVRQRSSSEQSWRQWQQIWHRISQKQKQEIKSEKEELGRRSVTRWVCR